MYRITGTTHNLQTTKTYEIHPFLLSSIDGVRTAKDAKCVATQLLNPMSLDWIHLILSVERLR